MTTRDTTVPTKKELDFHLGDDVKNCGMCQNWEIDGTCGVLQLKTPRSGVCNAFMGLEVDSGAPAEIGQNDLVDKMGM